ncbi:MAG: phosphoadenylyl-sulfate reductase [Zoogloeaceae bacterium]|jgi:phosphoadenosine phosphosulfate reductase|nr:phosphoadenylyl-sulfate reductase [Zoogloeaceae bacterium]
MSPDHALTDGQTLAALLDKIAGEIVLAFSYQAEDVVLLHLLQTHAAHRPVSVFTLETGKLFPETAAYHAEIEAFFGLVIHRYTPEATAVAALESTLGEWGMRHSLANRQHCCAVRKVAPLKRALAGKSAWLTGQRAAQSITRAGLQILEYDANNGLIKLNPLVAWSEEAVFAHARKHALPLHPRYAQGFRSIGCAPCTRAVAPDEELRAGRWWWENPEHKECGLHMRPKA